MVPPTHASEFYAVNSNDASSKKKGIPPKSSRPFFERESDPVLSNDDNKSGAVS
jgi:hypothetical protein